MRFSVFVAVVVMSATSALAQTPPVPRPVADFATLPFMSGPELSPDGRRVAAKLGVQGKQVLAIVDLFDKTKRPPVVLGLGENDLLSWSWVNDDWLVIRVGSVVNAEGVDFYVTRVAGVKSDGTMFKPIGYREGGESARVVWTAQDGTPRILLSRQKSIYSNDPDFWPSVEDVDVSTGKARMVVGPQANVWDWYADASGAVRMGIGYDDNSRTSRLLYRPDGKGAFRVLDRANQRRDERLTVPYLMTSGAAASVTISDSGGYDALHELDLSTLTVGKQVYNVEGYDIDGVVMAPDGARVAGVAYTSDRSRMHWMDPALAEIQAILDKAVGTRAAAIMSTSRDQKKMLVQVGDASQPGSIYYFDAGSGEAMYRIADINGATKSATLGPVSTFRYKARDGLSIEAVMTLPKGRSAKGLPLILMPHGGPEARDSASYDWWAQFLADRGYAVVQPNYRGSTGYGTKFLKAGDGEWGLKMQDDLNDVVDDLANKGTIDPKRVCIVGASYGGYAALRGAQRDGGRYKCAISYAGVSDLNGMITYDGKFLNAKASKASWKQSAPDLKAVSPIYHAAEFSTPILIMHGKKDRRVPVAQSRRMVDKLKAAGKVVEYVEQPEGDHYFSREGDRFDFLTAMERFLKRYNPS